MKFVLRYLVAAVLAFAACAAGAQQDYGAYHFLSPYDGNTLPLDLSKAALGTTKAEACGKRSEAEYRLFYPGNDFHPLVTPGCCQTAAAASDG
jgi:hypothetical protein